jgi:pyruvate ferredoxin oxidoreductase delta subunit
MKKEKITKTKSTSKISASGKKDFCEIDRQEGGSDKKIKSGGGMAFTKGFVISEPGSTMKYKTGNWRTFRPIIERAKCIKCGICWANCPDAAIKKDADGTFIVDYDYCKGCLICDKLCPVKAISHEVEQK